MKNPIVWLYIALLVICVGVGLSGPGSMAVGWSVVVAAVAGVLLGYEVRGWRQ